MEIEIISKTNFMNAIKACGFQCLYRRNSPSFLCFVVLVGVVHQDTTINIQSSSTPILNLANSNLRKVLGRYKKFGKEKFTEK